MAISFGDNVRVLTTQLTTALGLAGLTGAVYGETTPSDTGVEVSTSSWVTTHRWSPMGATCRIRMEIACPWTSRGTPGGR